MKRKILEVLHHAGTEFVSGQMLCEQLGISRQAVWKYMTQLKEQGYILESVSNKGYRLQETPDRMYGPDMESRLDADGICQKIEYHDVIDSTNIRAKQLAETGEPEGTLVVADQQSSGKGRRGRSWSSEWGTGIYMSLILRPSLSPQQTSSVTILAALAVAKAVDRCCCQKSSIHPQIKWPNDIVLNGKKVCGILTEMSSEMDYVHYAVVGIGINANNASFPEEVASVAGSIATETGDHVDRQQLVADIMNAFGGYYCGLIKYKDLSFVVDEYNGMLANRDQEVKIYHGMVETAKESEIEQGVAQGIDNQGALLVKSNHGIEKVVSGEVSVRGLYGYV